MRSRGETTRSLGKAVGASSAAVTGWTSGASPRPSAAGRIAQYFGVPVEVLLNDSLDLPADPDQDRVEDPAGDHLVSAPLRAAARAADKVPGSPIDRQKAFETYLRQIHELRAQAEKIAGGNTSAAVAVFDRMLATWLALDEGTSAEERAILERGANAASMIIHQLPHNDADMKAAQAKLAELKERAAAEEAGEYPKVEKRHG